jgi:energy-coupling factor transport system substrate-specific component
MRNKKAFIMVTCAMSITLNIVLGTLVQRLQIPLLFLDTIGTIFAAILFGPWYGAAVGTLTNVLTPILAGNTRDIPFFIVNAVTGLIVGYIAKKYKFNLLTAIITGLILSIVCPAIGSPIGVWLYGGLTGSGTDFIFAWFRVSGMSIFSAEFASRIPANILDKMVSVILVYLSMKYIPKQYKQNANISV